MEYGGVLRGKLGLYDLCNSIGNHCGNCDSATAPDGPAGTALQPLRRNRQYRRALARSVQDRRLARGQWHMPQMRRQRPTASLTRRHWQSRTAEHRNKRLAEPVFVGLDAGTTGVKATAFLADGRPVGSVRAELPMLSPVPGAAEQDPDQFVETCFAVLAECAARVREQGFAIAAVGLSGIIGSLVVLDRACRPLGMAFTWADSALQPAGRRGAATARP